MATKIDRLNLLPSIGIIVLQLIATQVVTLLASFILPGMEQIQENLPIQFMIFVGLTFSLGIYLAGLIGIGWKPVAIQPLYILRAVCTVFCVFFTLVIGLVINTRLEAGSPFFAISILAGILGFYLPGWFPRKRN